MSRLFEQEILAAVSTLETKNICISMSKLTSELTTIIIDNYDGTSLYQYKSVWTERIKGVLSTHDIPYKVNKANWEKIAFAIHEKERDDQATLFE